MCVYVSPLLIELVPYVIVPVAILTGSALAVIAVVCSITTLIPAVLYQFHI